MTNLAQKLTNAEQLPGFNHWGAYKGMGTGMKGINQGKDSSHFRLFETNDAVLTVLEVWGDKYEPQVAPGLQLIESSFVLKSENGKKDQTQSSEKQTTPKH